MYKNVSFIITACILIVAGWTGCNNNPSGLDEGAGKSGNGSEQSEKVDTIYRNDGKIPEVQVNNYFAFNLLRAVNKTEGSNNVLLSPLSATLALATLNNGAGGATRDELQAALGYGDVSTESMNRSLKEVQETLLAAETPVVESVNSVWADKRTVNLLPAFIDAGRLYYDAAVFNEDFRNPATLGMVNAWCAEKTHNKIPKLLDALIGDIYIINALYLNAKWHTMFDTSLTKQETFTGSNGQSQNVPMMNAAQSFMAAREEKFDIIEMDYKDCNLAMAVILPRKGVSLTSVIAGLDADSWSKLLGKMYLHLVTLKIPRVEMEFNRKLNADLEEVGIQSLFDNPDLFLIDAVNPPKNVNVVQKNVIEINEEGTEAASATYVEMWVSAGIFPPSLEFHADRPFLFIIHEKTTGVILYTGKVEQL